MCIARLIPRPQPTLFKAGLEPGKGASVYPQIYSFLFFKRVYLCCHLPRFRLFGRLRTFISYLNTALRVSTIVSNLDYSQ